LKKINLAICEKQESYRNKLKEFFICKKGDKLQVTTFSDPKAFGLTEEEGLGFDVVLLGLGFEVPKKQKGCLLLRLTEELQDSREGIPILYKYQSGEDMLREIFARYQELGLEEPCLFGGKKEMIAVYSPCRSKMRTPFALTLARQLGEQQKLLYLNFDEWAGFGPWLGETYHRDLSDLLYLLDQGTGKGLLESVVHTLNQVDYIPPMWDGQLLAQTGEESYEKLICFLEEQNAYESILLDFGIMVPGFFSLLHHCSRMYVIVEGGGLTKWQLSQFEEALFREGDGLEERMEKITFSSAEALALEGIGEPNQWLYGILGDKAREVRGDFIGTY
jgi:hypothetical protein